MKRRWLYLLGASSVAGYAAWRAASRPPRPGAPELLLEGRERFGEDRGRGCLLAVQPFLLPVDYASEESFTAKLEGYLDEAARAGFLGPRSVVVLPAHLGTWLVTVDEGRRVYSAPTFERAMALTVASNLGRYVTELFPLEGGDPFSAALFRAKATRMADVYGRSLGGLARRYGVTLVGGSLLLPSPDVVDGRLVAGRKALREVTAVFGPDGRAVAPLSVKSSLEPDERGFVEAGQVSEPGVYETPAGRLGVLVGRDAFQPLAYAALRAREVDLVATPAYLSGKSAWTSSWPGYLGDAPPDANRHDFGRLLEAEAWQRYGLAGRLREAGAKAGAASFFRGALWDRRADGAALVVAGEQAHQGPLVSGASLTCLWL